MKYNAPQRLLLTAALGALVFGACEADDSNSGSDANPNVDIADAAAARDGSIVQCQADHQESLEDRNDRIINEANQVEPTGLVISKQGGFSVCGQLDPEQEFGDFADVDVYEFTVSGEQDLRLQLTLDGAAPASDVEFILFGADGPSTVAEAKLQGQTALTHRVVPAGTYWIAVLAKSPLGGAPVPYRIEASPEAIDCEHDGDTAGDYTESLDGDDSRGNDTLGIDYEDGDTFAETASTTDAPETTSIVLTPGDRIGIFGSVANVEPLDDYRDRDTFLIHTGPETRELALRMSWEHSVGVDLDVHLFEAGQPQEDLSFAGAATVGASIDELATFAVLPDRDYWVWVGAYANSEPQLPQDYSLALCGKSL